MATLALDLVLDALMRVERLRDEVTRLSRADYSSSASREFAKLLLLVASEAELRIRACWHEHQQEKDEESLRELKLWDSVTRDASNHLRYLHGSMASRVPAGLSSALREWQQILV